MFFFQILQTLKGRISMLMKFAEFPVRETKSKVYLQPLIKPLKYHFSSSLEKLLSPFIYNLQHRLHMLLLFRHNTVTVIRRTLFRQKQAYSADGKSY